MKQVGGGGGLIHVNVYDWDGILNLNYLTTGSMFMKLGRDIVPMTLQISKIFIQMCQGMDQERGKKKGHGVAPVYKKLLFHIVTRVR